MVYKKDWTLNTRDILLLYQIKEKKMSMIILYSIIPSIKARTLDLIIIKIRFAGIVKQKIISQRRIKNLLVVLAKIINLNHNDGFI